MNHHMDCTSWQEPVPCRECELLTALDEWKDVAFKFWEGVDDPTVNEELSEAETMFRNVVSVRDARFRGFPCLLPASERGHG